MDSGLSRGILFIFDLALAIITVALGVGMLMGCLAPVVNPNRTAIFALAGLAAPALYVMNLLAMLFWTVRWKRMALLPVVVILIGLPCVNKYYRPHLGRVYDETEAVREPGTIRILTYNVSGFWSYGPAPRRNTMSDIKAYIKEQDPDIICLQEFEVNNRHSLDDFREGMDDWRYNQIHYTLGEGEPIGWGVAVFSKFPLANKEHIAFPASNNASSWADVVIRRDTVHLFNCHLQTTQIGEEDREFLGRDIADMTDSIHSDMAKGIVRKLERNFRLRADQADSIAGHIRNYDRSVIVCGDFNDTPMSYAYRTIKGPLVDAFRTQGRGTVATYKELWGVFRIDYIFYSRDFRTAGYRSDDLPWSDHNPVIVDIKRH